MFSYVTTLKPLQKTADTLLCHVATRTTFNLPESLRLKVFARLVALHYEAQRRKLTTSVADQSLCEHLGKHLLKSQRLKSSECSSWVRKVVLGYQQRHHS